MRGPFTGLTVDVLAARLRAGGTDPVRLVEAALDAALASQPTLNAFVTLDPDGAVRAAAEARDELARGVDRGVLHGLPVALKDLVDTAGLATTMGSRHFAGHLPATDAEVVTRLRAAGAVIVGKATTHEFAYGPTGDIAANGPCANPHDPGRMAGGSSAGSAAAVAAGLVPVAVGTDTGGSVRIPAALCGVVGIRPSPGLVPAGGVFPLAGSLDAVGVLAADVAGTLAALRVLAGPSGTGRGARRWSPGELRVGLVTGAWFERLADAVSTPFGRFVDRLSGAGARIEPMPVPDAAELHGLYVTVQSAEAVAIHRERVARAPHLFEPETLQRLTIAAGVDAGRYAAGRQRMAEVRAGAAGRFAGVDVLLLPTVPVVAPPLGTRDADIGGGWTSPRDALLAHTALWGVLGLPAVSLPVAGPEPAGLPVGAQLVGRPGGDLDLLGIAAAIEPFTRPGPSGV
jgi:Asp-tRNA(Asn)/Glu-tRNA(Gln) amidotransferase A subunit family amidase